MLSLRQVLLPLLVGGLVLLAAGCGEGEERVVTVIEPAPTPVGVPAGGGGGDPAETVPDSASDDGGLDRERRQAVRAALDSVGGGEVVEFSHRPEGPVRWEVTVAADEGEVEVRLGPDLRVIEVGESG